MKRQTVRVREVGQVEPIISYIFFKLNDLLDKLTLRHCNAFCLIHISFIQSKLNLCFILATYLLSNV